MPSLTWPFKQNWRRLKFDTETERMSFKKLHSATLLSSHDGVFKRRHFHTPYKLQQKSATFSWICTALSKYEFPEKLQVTLLSKQMYETHRIGLQSAISPISSGWRPMQFSFVLINLKLNELIIWPSDCFTRVQCSTQSGTKTVHNRLKPVRFWQKTIVLRFLYIKNLTTTSKIVHKCPKCAKNAVIATFTPWILLLFLVIDKVKFLAHYSAAAYMCKHTFLTGNVPFQQPKWLNLTGEITYMLGFSSTSAQNPGRVQCAPTRAPVCCKRQTNRVAYYGVLRTIFTVQSRIRTVSLKIRSRMCSADAVFLHSDVSRLARTFVLRSIPRQLDLHARSNTLADVNANTTRVHVTPMWSKSKGSSSGSWCTGIRTTQSDLDKNQSSWQLSGFLLGAWFASILVTWYLNRVCTASTHGPVEHKMVVGHSGL